MKKNVPVAQPAPLTHGGAPAARINAEAQLRRSVLSTLLWEDQFYENGQTITDRIRELAARVAPEKLAALAIEAREVQKLRHVPLLLASTLTRSGGALVGDTIAHVIQRADELGEFLALYWGKGKTPLSKQVKRGLAMAFTKFDSYALSKYNRDAAIKLRDVLFLTHAKPKDEAQAQVWKRLVDGTLDSADTWEVALSAGKDKHAQWARMLSEGKLGYLALLRNLRNMEGAGVDKQLIRQAILARKGADRVLPFRFIAAAKAAPSFEPELDQALLATMANLPVFTGTTALLVDVSGSMDQKLSGKSDLTRMDAAATLAAIFPGKAEVFSFSERLVQVPARKGMAGVDAIKRSQGHGRTEMAEAVQTINRKGGFDRIVVITDEQATTFGVPKPKADLAYFINVASAKNGVGYGAWTHLDGFSENILRWMALMEQEKLLAA
jgi:60 kDa SS-A/Ro ribonucleoprotein